jgi:glycosyltransferase involved in cell wall biosynthesis
MRVLQVTTVYFPELQFGGPPQKIHALSRGLAARGHDVQVVTLHSARPAARDSLAVDGVTVRYLAWWGRGNWRLPRQGATLAEAVAWADVVHLYGLYNLLGPAAAAAARRAGRPYLLEPQGMLVPRGGHRAAKRLYHRLFTRRLAANAARLIATSPAEAGELASLAPPPHLVTRRNGIDVAAFAHLPPGDTFRRQIGATPADRIVLFVGRISPIKNLEALVRAFQAAALHDARLALVGPQHEADYVARLQRLVQDLGLAARVHFTGPLYGEAVRAALGAASLFVLPSTFESYGNAAAEAAVAGVPVLISDTCGIAPTLHRRAGLAVPPTVDGLAAGLHALLDDASLRAEVMADRFALLDQLSWDEPLAQMEAVYQQVLDESRPRA